MFLIVSSHYARAKIFLSECYASAKAEPQTKAPCPQSLATKATEERNVFAKRLEYLN